MVYLKDRGLLDVLAMPEWAQKEKLANNKLRTADWIVMENIVCFEGDLMFFLSIYHLYRIILKIFNEITLQLSHSSACISEVKLFTVYIIHCRCALQILI